MKAKREILGSRKAFVTVYLAFTMLTLIPMVGLAIDFSVLYNVKGRLQQACDAGAIGAGNLVQSSTDVTDPTTNAKLRDAVQRYFNANLTPVPWSATQMSYTSTITQDATTRVRTIYVTATYNVPMLFMRVLGVNNSQVAAQAIAKIRFVNLMVVVDRSGSVDRTSTGGTLNSTIIKTDLTDFIGNSATSIFVDGRDVVGLLSFGGNYNLDYSPQIHFQTSAPNINTAISNIPFGNNATNTGEGLYQAWYQLAQLNQTGSLNVIVLITDGRPSAFTASFPVDPGSSCTSKANKAGVLTAYVSNPFPPPSSRSKSGIMNFTPACSGASCETTYFVSGSTGCSYTGASTNVVNDIKTIPAKIGPQDHTTGTSVPYVTTFDSTSGYFAGTSDATDAVAVRYASFNYAHNVAKAIRQDPTLRPVIYCVGLNWNPTDFPNEEPLDADFLATLANDQTYKSATAPTGVYQAGQTPGKYYNVTYSGLGAALQDIAGQILRLSAH